MSQRPKVIHNLIRPLLEKGWENEEEMKEVLSSNEVCFDQRSIYYNNRTLHLLFRNSKCHPSNHQ